MEESFFVIDSGTRNVERTDIHCPKCKTGKIVKVAKYV